jgi:hypothetical protein
MQQVWDWIAVLSATVVLLGAAGCSGNDHDHTSATSASHLEPTSSTVDAGAAREDLTTLEFVSGYAVGWRTGCDHAFERMLDTLTRDLQLDLRVEDCYALAPAEAHTVSRLHANAHDAGVRLGRSDGCRAAAAAVRRFGVVDWSRYPSLTESACR